MGKLRKVFIKPVLGDRLNLEKRSCGIDECVTCAQIGEKTRRQAECTEVARVLLGLKEHAVC